MSLSIAYLGPPGTNTETAAMAYVEHLKQITGQECMLCPDPTIAASLETVALGEAALGVVPVENSLEGSVSVTLDTLWQLHDLQIQKALVLPISHALISWASSLSAIKTVYSHPQALAQCQGWLEKTLPSSQLIPTNSTTEAVMRSSEDYETAAIASARAAELYQAPILAHPINDRPENYTRFWVVGKQPSPGGSHTSLAFSFPANVPGALVKPLQTFANRGINMSRIESRPTKRSLGEYLFFIDLEADGRDLRTREALAELETYTETIKIFGSYSIVCN